MALDAEDLSDYSDNPMARQRSERVIQHELGHLVGLDHVADASQLMYTEGNPAQAGDWGTGDLVGLNVLGSQPCAPEL
ncbi:MAG: matrixin family metalloprotease [Microthrixaceae bacterium]